MKKLLLALSVVVPVYSGGEKKLPELKLEDVKTEKTFTLSEVKGKLAVFTFWASWCRVSRKAIKDFKVLKKKFKDVEFLLVTSEGKDEVKGYLKEKHPPFRVLLDKKAKLKESLSIRAIPHSLVVTPKGKILWEGSSTKLNEKVLKELLKE